MWTLYDAILDTLPGDSPIFEVTDTAPWTMARTQFGCGLAMTTDGSTRPPRMDTLVGRSLRQAAPCVKSWNLPEASGAMAAINSAFNTPDRLEALDCFEPYERYCTDGVDLAGKTLGIIGHMRMPGEVLQQAGEVFILERHPQPGDYPDSACEYLLPRCEVVLITGSALVNKTLPRLLQLCRDAYVIVTGPTVPMCPALLDCGIDRLAGLVPTDPEGLRRHVTSRVPGPPYSYGSTFLLKKD